MDLVRHLGPQDLDLDRARHQLEHVVRKLDPGTTILLKGRRILDFRRANKIATRLGSKVKVYRASSIEPIRKALAEFDKRKQDAAKHLESQTEIAFPVPTPAEVSTPGDQLGPLAFEGRPLLVRKDATGRGAVLVRDLEDVLDYAPGSLVKLINSEWSTEFLEGDRYGYMSRAELEAADRLAGRHSVTQNYGARNMVLYEHGVYQVAVKTEKDKGVAVRDWLTRDVMTELRRTGRYELPLQSAPAIAPAAPQLAPPLQVINEQIQHWDAWGVNANFRKDSKGAGHIDMHLWQVLTHEAPVRALKADGKTPKLRLEGRQRFNSQNIAKMARERGLGHHIDHLFIERLQLDLGIHAGNWVVYETRGVRVEEVTDQEGADLILDHLHQTNLQQGAREVPLDATGPAEFSIDRANELAEQWDSNDLNRHRIRV
jgi:prophage antirepressor-like protein